MKGQYFSFDAIVASIIFILTFISLVSYWFSVKSGLESKDEEISKEAARITDSMLTPSFLANSYEDRKVDKSRIEDLSLKSQQELKKMFNTQYNLSIVITTESGTKFAAIGPDPEDPADSGVFSDAANIAKIRRVFVLRINGTYETPAALDLYLYN